MGILRSLLTAPVTGPMKGTAWIAGQIHTAAEQQMNDPVMLRHTLQDLEAQLLRAEISEAEYDTAEDEILRRLQKASA